MMRTPLFVAVLLLPLSQPAPSPQTGGGIGSVRPNFANNLASCVQDKDINLCLRETLEELRTYMPKGIPELNLRPTEPLVLKQLVFNTGRGIVNVKSEFPEVTVRGMSKFETKAIHADPAKRTLTVSILIPRLDITGLYKIKGRVLIVDVAGQGDFVSSLEGVTARGSANIVVTGPSGDRRVSIRNTDLDFNIADSDVKMNNLFNGEFPLVADSANKFISENSNLVIEAVKPQIKQEMTKVLERVLNDAFSKVPVEDFVDKILAPSPSPVPLTRLPLVPSVVPTAKKAAIRDSRRIKFIS